MVDQKKKFPVDLLVGVTMRKIFVSSFFLSLSIALFLFDASFAQENTPFGADRHGTKNVTCKECHGEKNEIAAPDINQCSKCHAPDEIEKKTRGIKPQNPHVSPHYGNKLECTLCHLQHAAPENYCAQCHSFDFKVK